MAEPNPDLKTLEVCRVAPPPTPPSSAVASPTSLPLTHWDIPWLRFHPTQRLLFYSTPITAASFSDTVLPKLKHSLSLTLHHFLPVAGTLVWPPDSPEPFLQISVDAAVTLTVAESAGDFGLLSGLGFRDAAPFRSLVPRLPVSDSEAAAVALQITAFPGSGFSIGFSFHHAVVDGRTTSSFLKCWASVCRRGGIDGFPPELAPAYDRTSVSDAHGAKAAFLETLLDDGGPHNRSLAPAAFFEQEIGAVRGTFLVTRAELERLRDEIQRAWTRSDRPKPPRRPTTFAAASALVWACLVRADHRRYEEAGNTEAYFCFTADCRSRAGPPLPETYFGNCIWPFLTTASAGELAAPGGVPAAAAAIAEAVERIKENVVSFRAEDWQEILRIFGRHGRKLLSVAGSPHFGLSAADFGWGRAVGAEIVSTEGTGALGISESRDGDGGVEVGVVLNEQVMEAFASQFTQGLEN